MPFINGRFYMNPAYGRTLERSRAAKEDRKPTISKRRDLVARVAQSDSHPFDLRETEIPLAEDEGPEGPSASDLISAHLAPGGHWVTIGGRHVLIAETQAGRAQHSNRDTRQRIADTARKYDGSTDWAFGKRKGNFAPNTNKCNQYVYDVTNEAGAGATIVGSDGKLRPPLAAEWANPNKNIADWRMLSQNETPQPGDVAAYKLPGGGVSFSGHSGIVTSVDSNGLVHAMAAHTYLVGPDDKFNPGVDKRRAITYRRFTGGSQ